MRIPELVAAIQTVAASPLVPADVMVLAETAAAELAAHIAIGTASIGWWVTVCAGVSRDAEPPSIASLAREAGVIASRIYSGNMDWDECARVAAALDAERAIIINPLLRSLLERAEADVRQHRPALVLLTRTGADVTTLRGTLAAVEARRDIFARALDPIVLRSPLRLPDDPPDPDEPRPMVGRIAPARLYSKRQWLTCERCNAHWMTRVEEPKRCPHCQTWLDWRTAEAPAPPEASDDA